VILRPYQTRCIEQTREAFGRSRSVCIVAPTGAGKTLLGLEVVRRTLERRPHARALWIAHRTELIDQARDRADMQLNGTADRLMVATVQGLAVGKEYPAADLVVWDESHHASASAPHWYQVAEHYADSWRLGLTATPQRGDGSPLGDVFGEMVVAAEYSELIEGGWLVPCKVLRPERQLKGTELAQDPVDAWMAMAPDRQGFLFGGRVAECHEYASRLREAGITAEVIAGDTPSQDRDRHLRDFRAGKVQVLCSVYVLTEGVDVPAAEVCMLARGCQHAGTYLQMAGRVLRPSPGKTEALLLDLTGVSWVHGLPTDDREYALDGRAIKTKGQAEAEAEAEEALGDREITIYSMELLEVYAGSQTPKAAKVAEWSRLVGVARDRRWSLDWAGREYAKLFDGPPPASMDEKAETMRSLRIRASEKGYKKGWASHRYRAAFGVWPKGV